MQRTDRHFRYFLRLLAPDVRLYTEMLTAEAVLCGDQDKLLAYHPREHPLALQLGGNQPATLARVWGRPLLVVAVGETADEAATYGREAEAWLRKHAVAASLRQLLANRQHIGVR